MEPVRAKEDKREKTCCFTGHRAIPEAQFHRIEKKLEKTLVKLIEQGVIYYGAGGALGFDTMAAKTVLKLRVRFPQIKLILVLPCKSQADRWSEADKITYQEIMAQADKVVYTSEHYFGGCMHKRNRHLVDASSVCVCYLTEEKGGTAYTVGYAKENGLRVINIAELGWLW